MFVTFGPYRGFAVNDLNPIEAPNPRCCSNARVLCPRCALLVLVKEGITANCGAAVDPNDILIPPSSPSGESEQYGSNSDDSELLVPPRPMDILVHEYAQAANERRKTYFETAAEEDEEEIERRKENMRRIGLTGNADDDVLLPTPMM